MLCKIESTNRKKLHILSNNAVEHNKNAITLKIDKQQHYQNINNPLGTFAYYLHQFAVDQISKESILQK